MDWLKYTYMFVRMQRSPLTFGVDKNSMLLDPTLIAKRRDLVEDAAKRLN